MAAIRRTVLLAVAMVAVAQAAWTQDPRVPPGVDPGGVGIALLGPGIDYTDPALARRLARDGEGDLAGWDFVDNDNRPFETGGESPEGTGLARALALAAPRARLVALRASAASPVTLARGVAHAARTRTPVLATALTGATAEPWGLFQQAATHFADVLVIAGAQERYPGALGLATILTVAPVAADGTGLIATGADLAVSVTAAPSTPAASLEAIARMASLAARLAERDPALTGARLRAALAARARALPAAARGTTRNGWIAEPERD